MRILSEEVKNFVMYPVPRSITKWVTKSGIEKHVNLIDTRFRAAISRRMELRNHPLISYRGLPSWPPIWTPANPKSHLKSLRGEIGRLEYVLPIKGPQQPMFLIIEHEGQPYVGCLFVDDDVFCAQLIAVLQDHAGFTIKEIGDLDLSFTL